MEYLISCCWLPLSSTSVSLCVWQSNKLFLLFSFINGSILLIHTHFSMKRKRKNKKNINQWVAINIFALKWSRELLKCDHDDTFPIFFAFNNAQSFIASNWLLLSFGCFLNGHVNRKHQSQVMVLIEKVSSFCNVRQNKNKSPECIKPLNHWKLSF